jgi:hypothetical protein
MITPTLLAMFGLGPTESLIVAITLALSAFWVWMLVDCAKRISSGDSKQVGWLMVGVRRPPLTRNAHKA